jgi:hypothetical protein
MGAGERVLRDARRISRVLTERCWEAHHKATCDRPQPLVALGGGGFSSVTASWLLDPGCR